MPFNDHFRIILTSESSNGHHFDIIRMSYRHSERRFKRDVCKTFFEKTLS